MAGRKTAQRTLPRHRPQPLAHRAAKHRPQRLQRRLQPNHAASAADAAGPAPVCRTNQNRRRPTNRPILCPPAKIDVLLPQFLQRLHRLPRPARPLERLYGLPRRAANRRTAAGRRNFRRPDTGKRRLEAQQRRHPALRHQLPRRMRRLTADPRPQRLRQNLPAAHAGRTVAFR